jgi:hypothetical protein
MWQKFTRRYITLRFRLAGENGTTDMSKNAARQATYLPSKEREAAFVNTPVCQISRYPSSDRRIENAVRSHPGGVNTSNALGKDIRHPGLGGVMVVGRSLATIAARLVSSEKVGSVGPADFPSNINERTGSSRGSLCTCSSDSRRYRPSSIRRIQASRLTVPRIQDRQSEKYFGNVSRFDVSTVVCRGMRGLVTMDLVVYPLLPDPFFTSLFLFSISHGCRLTFTQFYRTLQAVGGEQRAPH